MSTIIAKTAVLLLACTAFLLTVTTANSFSVPEKAAISGYKPDTGAIHNGLTVSLTTSAHQCGICHQKAFHEWRFAAGSDLDTVGKGTSHAVSSTEAMYVTMLQTLEPPIQFGCRGCHEPGNAWIVPDKVNGTPEPRTFNVTEGVNCVVCHYNGQRIVTKGEMNSPLFCATCHNDATGCTDTYTEWLNDYRGGKTCIQCHMKKDSHVFRGMHSPSLVRSSVSIGEPIVPSNITANVPFTVTIMLTNQGAGHSVPQDLLRKMQVKLSLVDGANTEVFAWEKSFYKRFVLFGENPADNEVIKAGETKTLNCEAVAPNPGVHTVRVELMQDTNRLGIENTTIFMGATYKTVIVR